jgi:hypothetical protein
MKDKNENQSYAVLLGKLNSLDSQLIQVKEQIEELKKLLTIERANEFVETKEETCSKVTSKLKTIRGAG